MATDQDIQDPPMADGPADERPAVGDGGELDLGYQVAIDQFSGPLDLLLYLVKRTEVDIVDIPLATITDQFVATLAAWQSLDLDVAGDFIVMAAALLEFKARQLVPPPERPEGDAGEGDDFEDVLDPRADLIQRLLQYRRFKDAAVLLDEHEAVRSRMAVRQMREAIPEDVANEPEIELTDLDVHQLYRSFEVQMARISGLGPRRVVLDEIPIDVRIQRLIDTLQAEKHTSLSRLLGEERSRGSQAGVLVASLEIVRQRFAEVRQLEQYGEADLRWREADERGIATELPPEEVEPGGRRRRRPPLVTFFATAASAASAADAVDEAAEQAADEAEERLETDEQRFLRELDESCNLSSVLATVADVEEAFIAAWQETHAGELPPTIAVERAAEFAAREEAQRQAAAKEAERVQRDAERAARAAARAEQRSAQWEQRKDQILAARAKREAAAAAAATVAETEAGVPVPVGDGGAPEAGLEPADAATPPVLDRPVSSDEVVPVVVETGVPTEHALVADVSGVPDGDVVAMDPDRLREPVMPDAASVEVARAAENVVTVAPATETVATVVPRAASHDDALVTESDQASERAALDAAPVAVAFPPETDAPSASAEAVPTVMLVEVVPPSPLNDTVANDTVATETVLAPVPEAEAVEPVATEPLSVTHAAPASDDDEGLSPAAAAILAAAEELFASSDQTAEDAEEPAAARTDADEADVDDPAAVNAALLAATTSDAVEDDDDDELLPAEVAEHDLLRSDDEEGDEHDATLAGDPGLHPPTQVVLRTHRELDPDHLRLIHTGAADAGEADDDAVPPDVGEPAVAAAALTTGMAAVIEGDDDPEVILGPPEGPVLTGVVADSTDEDGTGEATPIANAGDPEIVALPSPPGNVMPEVDHDHDELDPELLLGAAGVAPDEEPEPAGPTPRETAVYRSLVNTDAAAADDDAEPVDHDEATAITAVATPIAAPAPDPVDLTPETGVTRVDEIPPQPPDPLPPPVAVAPPPPPPPPATPPRLHPAPTPSPAPRLPSTAQPTIPIAAPAPMRPSHHRFWLAVAALALLNVLGWLTYSAVVWVPRNLLEVSAPAAIQGDAPWHFRFNLDSVAADAIGTTPTLPPTILPEIPGQWRWSDARTLTFAPAVELPPGMTVLVTWPTTALETPHRLRLGQDLSCALRTAPLVASDARVLAFAEDGRHTVEVAFDAAIEPERLRDRVSVVDGDGVSHPAAVISAAKAATLRLEVGGKDVVPAPGPAEVALSPAAPGPQDLASPQRLDSGWRGVVHLGHRLHVTHATASAPARGETAIVLRLDVPDADRTLLRDSLSVEPEAAYAIDDAADGLVLRGAFQPGTTYVVRVAARHPAHLDSAVPLAAHPAASSHAVTIPDREPGLWLAGDVERLTLTGVNCGTVVVTVRDGDDQEIARHLLALDAGEANTERSRELALADLLPHLPVGSFRLVAEAEGVEAAIGVTVRDVAISPDRWRAATGPWLIRQITGDGAATPRLRLASVVH